MIEVTLIHGCCGWAVEWFEEDGSAPMGYRTAHWYGSYEACRARMLEPPPPLRPEADGPCRDAATATGMYDP